MTDRPDYLPATLIDRDAQDIFDAARLRADTVLEDWGQHEGDPMVVALETTAQQIDELIFVANRKPQEVVEAGVANLFQVARDLGAPPVTTVRFAVSANGLIEAGTELVLELGSDAFTFVTDEDLNATTPSSTVTATGTENSSRVNGTASGTTLRVRSTTASIIDGATVDVDVTSGRDPESTNTWFARAQLKAARSTQTLGPAASFETFALETAGVPRAFVVDNYDPDSGNDPGDDLGHVTVYVYGDGATLSTGDKDDLTDAMQALAIAGLIVHVADPDIMAVDVTATGVVRNEGYTNGQAEDAAEAALAAFLSTDTSAWSPTLYRNDLIALLEALPEIYRVPTGQPSTPAADVTLGGPGSLTAPGTISVSIVAP